MNAPTRLSLVALSLLAVGCPGNQAGVQNTTTTLKLDVLAVTAVDPDLGGRVVPKVYLNWNEVPGVSKYELNTPGSTKPLQATGERIYVDETGIKEGDSYSYYVRALDATNAEKIKSETVTTKVLAHAITPVVTLKATPSDVAPGKFNVPSRQPKLYWDPVDKATGYYVKLVDYGSKAVVFSSLVDSPEAQVGQLPNKTLTWTKYTQTGEGVSLTSGNIYNYSVWAITADGKTLKESKAIDVSAESSALIQITSGS